MKSSKIILLGLCALAAASCAKPVAKIQGAVSGASDSEIIAAKLDMNVYNILDTIKTNADGKFSYKVEVAEGQPEFLYFFHNGTKIASLLLEKGDNVSFSADTLGNWTVEGSEESEKLLQVEKDFADFAKKMDSSTESAVLTRAYVDYYRSRVKYVMQNPYSLTVIPVLYQALNPELPVFGQVNDALHFRAAADSLMKVYPESRYVKALDKEAARREQLLGLNSRLSAAGEASYPDFTLKNDKGENVSLSSIDSKVVMLYFWTASNAEQKMFNLETLKPLYDDFNKKGFEIVAVALDGDKAAWASTIKSQELKWVNLVDPNGMSAALYNVSEIPSSFLIVDGELSTKSLTGVAALRQELNRLLK